MATEWLLSMKLGIVGRPIVNRLVSGDRVETFMEYFSLVVRVTARWHATLAIVIREKLVVDTCDVQV